MKTPHLARFGAEEIPRSAFLAQLRSAVAQPARLGPWAVEMTADAAIKVIRQERNRPIDPDLGRHPVADRRCALRT